MYKAFNQNLVCKKPAEEKTESGIILTNSQDTGAVIELEVVDTTEETKDLQGKRIYSRRMHVVEMPDGKYGVVPLENVLAVK